ncbi:MAG TPA: hypothetical protein VFG72_09355 [Marmoricola sp.]|nr:hypothetical protein [Marmoricola sp.]
MLDPRRVCAATVLAVGLPSLAGCQQSEAPAPARPDVLVEFSFDDGSIEEALEHSSGALDVSASVTSLNHGKLRVVPGRDGGGAVQFPSFDPSPKGERAVLRVLAPSGTNAFSPGDSDFTFAATFRLDARSQGSTSDNGDNLLQFGRYGADAQYKLDIDDHSPACRVKGDRGAVAAKLSMDVNASDWYTVTCQRDGESIKLRVVQLGSDGPTREWTKSASGDIGSVTSSNATTPLSVGGKLTFDGQIDPSSDQFNGEVDDVLIRLDE